MIKTSLATHRQNIETCAKMLGKVIEGTNKMVAKHQEDLESGKKGNEPFEFEYLYKLCIACSELAKARAEIYHAEKEESDG